MDFLGGADSTEKAQEIYKNSKDMSKGGFNLTKWNSNSEEVINMINSSEKSRKTFTSKSVDFTQDDESYTKSMVGPADNQDGKFVEVLGVNTKADKFLFNFTESVKFANTLPVTNRSLWKISLKVFDPLGFLSPNVIRFINNVRRKVKHKVNKRKQDEILEVWLNEQLCADEINHVKTYWIPTIQANSFASEIQFLRNGNQSKPRRVELSR